MDELTQNIIMVLNAGHDYNTSAEVLNHAITELCNIYYWLNSDEVAALTPND